MEKLANKISIRIASELSSTSDDREVIEYGLKAIFQTVLTLAIVVSAGLLFGILTEAAVVCLSVGILRKYSGGAHSSSMMSCTIISVIACLGLGAMGKWISVALQSEIIITIICFLIFSVSFLVAVKRAPIDSINKPINSDWKKRKMKRATLIILNIYMLVSAVIIFSRDLPDIYVSVLICLMLGVIWQMSSLTTSGKSLLEGVDRLVYSLISSKGGHNSNEKD